VFRSNLFCPKRRADLVDSTVMKQDGQLRYSSLDYRRQQLVHTVQHLSFSYWRERKWLCSRIWCRTVCQIFLKYTVPLLSPLTIQTAGFYETLVNFCWPKRRVSERPRRIFIWIKRCHIKLLHTWSPYWSILKGNYYSLSPQVLITSLRGVTRLGVPGY
jgi:hypothetical protein